MSGCICITGNARIDADRIPNPRCPIHGTSKRWIEKDPSDYGFPPTPPDAPDQARQAGGEWHEVDYMDEEQSTSWFCRCENPTEPDTEKHTEVLELDYLNDLTAAAQQAEDAYLKGVASVTAIRCSDHYGVSPRNANEANGGECGACIEVNGERAIKVYVDEANEHVAAANRRLGEAVQQVERLKKFVDEFEDWAENHDAAFVWWEAEPDAPALANDEGWQTLRKLAAAALAGLEVKDAQR